MLRLSRGFEKLRTMGSNSQISRALGVRPNQVDTWARGSTPRMPYRERIKSVYGIPVTDWDLPAVEMKLPGAEIQTEYSPPLFPPLPESTDDSEEEFATYSGELGTSLEEIEKTLGLISRELHRTDVSPSQKIALLGQHRQYLALRNRIMGDSRSDEQRLQMSPTWAALRTRIIDALKPFPEALAAVAKAFDEPA